MREPGSCDAWAAKFRDHLKRDVPRVASSAALHRRRDVRIGLAPQSTRPVEVAAALTGVSLPSSSTVGDALTDLGQSLKIENSRRPIVSLDIETGGFPQTAGGIVGMVALGWHEASVVHVRQWTLLAPAGERAMLGSMFTELFCHLHEGARLVTFNGSSFDVPFLRSRATRLGLDAHGLPRTHLDLLMCSRRIFGKSFVDCRLATLEAEALRIHRVGDPQGWEVAEILNAVWRADQDPSVLSELRRAEVHNTLDTVSLIALASRLSAEVQCPQTQETKMSVARHLLRLGRVSEARRHLVALTEVRDVHRAVEAALCLAGIHRRSCEYEAAAALWRWVCEIRPGHIEAHEALAKHLEHRRRQPAEALAVASASWAPCARRVERLRRKLTQ